MREFQGIDETEGNRDNREIAIMFALFSRSTLFPSFEAA
jgi:hypothetical protein